MAEYLFNLYEIFVEFIFGSVGLSIVGIAVVLMLILLISRASFMFIFFWMFFYFLVMVTMYIGALGLVLAFVLSSIYFSFALIRLLFRND